MTVISKIKTATQSTRRSEVERICPLADQLRLFIRLATVSPSPALQRWARSFRSREGHGSLQVCSSPGSGPQRKPRQGKGGREGKQSGQQQIEKGDGGRARMGPFWCPASGALSSPGDFLILLREYQLINPAPSYMFLLNISSLMNSCTLFS